MALQKQGIQINFGQGLDTKTDPNQVQLGKMLSLQNGIFDVGGLLKKRNGFQDITQIPATNITTLASLQDGLVGIGTELYSFADDVNQWVNKGSISNVQLEVLPVNRDSYNNTNADSAVAPNGLAVVTFHSNSSHYYTIIETSTGQAVIKPVLLEAQTTRARPFVLGNYFIVTYLVQIGGAFHIKYIPIPMAMPNSPLSIVDATSQAKNGTDYYDGVVVNNALYVFFNASDVGGATRAFVVDYHLNLTPPLIITTDIANIISVTADVSGASPFIWLQTYDSVGLTGKASAYTLMLAPVLSPTINVTGDVANLTGIASSNVLTFLDEINNVYPTTAIKSNYVTINTITLAGSLGTPTVLERSVGLASKAFDPGYVLVAYNGSFQPSYFLISLSGDVIAKLAYSNGGGYPIAPLPSVSVNNEKAYISYLIKDFLATLNRTQGASTASPVYTQTGVNLATFLINSGAQQSQEIAGSLQINGGYVWEYDGVNVVESGFHLFPEDVIATPSAGVGSMTAQQYFYQVTYEWTDAAGALQRSAPSIPTGALLTGGQNTVTLQIPTLRLTAKENVRVVIYRWSTAQQTYYQITSITAPTINNKTVDTISYVDEAADSAILGNNILYTTGGVLENIAAPATYASTLFKSRLFIVDAENRNLIWYSKQVLETTPVEMSDLQTIFVAPNASASGSSGPITALSAMDDKLIIFKRDSIYYITGNGPDATGANNDFSEPTFITSTVGCTNVQSVTFTPLGLMFQSDKGIWLLSRDLSTQYIGAPVEKFNAVDVLGGLTIPDTNQIRFTMDDGNVLMYDYYYGQWGTFVGIPSIACVLWQGEHTFLDKFGRIRQELKGSYLDGAQPVLMQFTSAWFKLSGLQGFQRAYHMFILGKYYSPHKLSITLAYDYDPSPSQTTLIMPTNYNPPFGSDPIYGDGSPYGGPSQVEQWRIFFNRQKCEAVSISIQETFDSTFGTIAGAGLTLSGINMVIGTKLDRPKLTAGQSVA